MRPLIALGVAALLVYPTIAPAASCPDLSAPAIVGPAAASAKCLSTIAKSATGYVKAKMKAQGKCLSGLTPGACPNAKDDAKIQKAAVKASGKIAKACGDDTVQAGLGGGYGSTGDESKIASCMLSQHNATTEVMLGHSNGTPADWPGSKDREKCAKELSKAATKLATGALKVFNKCVDGQIKAGTAGDLAPICVGSFDGLGAFVAPSDVKAADKIAKLIDKTEASIDKKCGGLPTHALSTSNIASIFACPGAETADDLKDCIVCENWSGAMTLLAQQYGETGSFVENTAGALQAAVSAASPGDRLLIAPGDYAEEVVINTDDLELIGCGGATNERPRVVPPAGPGPFPNGIFAANVDGLVFQSLEVFDWEENGIFVTGANGVTFRDVIGDGNLNSLYAIFPVVSDGVLVEGCRVTRVTDAGIYVGQSTNITVRYNRVDANVAGIEIENSAFADVHNNEAIGNTGGILVFKLPGPPVQLSNDHDVHHNVSLSNNTENFGEPGSTVSLIPDGTGIFVISNDTTDFHHNIVRDNNSLGFTLIDQEGINSLVGAPVFDPTSADQKAEDNHIYMNVIENNGGAPDNTGDNATPVGGNVVFFLEEDAAHGNCFELLGSLGNLFLTANDCP